MLLSNRCSLGVKLGVIDQVQFGFVLGETSVGEFCDQA